ncbi:MAG: ribonuclease D [Verrucomicrobiales bacterium]
MSEHASGAAPFPLDASYELIESSEALDAYLHAVADASFVYMDLEADNLHHYREQLCLIQLHAGGRTALVDPLAVENCHPLLEFLDDPRRELWMHGADFDMTLMLAAFDWLPARIYDTQIAALLVGRRQFGLAALVHHYLGVTLSKSSQKEDWSRRPLTARMLEYAAIDASVLVPIKEKLVEEVRQAGRWEWLLQGCAHARRQALTRPPRDEDQVWRIQGWGGLKGRELAFLKALWFWRDAESERRDVPTFKVLSNQELLVMAAELEAKGRCEVRRKLTREARSELSELVEEVRGLPQSAWPVRTRTVRRAKPKGFDEKFDRWRALRDGKGAELGIDPTVIANRRNLELLVLGDEAEEKPMLLPWQRSILGLETE